jgi:hypothetical protein
MIWPRQVAHELTVSHPGTGDLKEASRLGVSRQALTKFVMDNHLQNGKI